jgi:hypothetical protein
VGVRGWFFGVVRDRAGARRRAQRRRARREARSAVPEASEAPATRCELREEVERALARLDPDDREAVRLRFLLDLEYREVAHLVGATEGACRVRVHRALDKLRRLLGPGAGALLASAAFSTPARAAILIRSAIAAAPASTGAQILGGSLLMTATQKTVLTVAAVALCSLGLGVGIGFHVAPRSSPGVPTPPGGAQPPEASRGTAGSAPAPPGLTIEDVRRVVAEELERHSPGVAGSSTGETDGESRGGSGPPADPERTEEVKAMLAGLRQVLFENDMRYDMGTGSPLLRPDPSRPERFPDERVWPKQVLGWIQTDPAKYVTVGADGEGFNPMQARSAFVFTTPLDRAIATVHEATLVFDAGIAASGTLTHQGFGTIVCRGDLAGKVHLESYATVVVEGDLTGSIETKSYATILVKGELSGAFTSHSYANLRVMGGFTGRMSLNDGNNLYFGGYLPQQALDRVEFRGRATVTFENTDLPPGKHEPRPPVEVIVLEP